MTVKQPRVAYFCMEYGIHDYLPIYAGGLGILAGDILKTARDLSYPLVGIGILWKQGYTTQLLNEEGWPCDYWEKKDFTPYLQDTGKTVTVHLKQSPLYIKIWQLKNFGTSPLFLLDADLPQNDNRTLTQRLYYGLTEDRVSQEIILGIGGIRALRALGIEVDIYHFNEGHAVLAGTELIREKMVHSGYSFTKAWEYIKRKIVFTTHTPMPAGNEVHDHKILQYLGAYNNLSSTQMAEIGGNPFNMTIAGLRLAFLANTVSKLHGQTARKMWQHVTPKAGIIAITNGVHRQTWQDKSLYRAYERGKGLWEAHLEAKKKLLSEIKKRCGVEWDLNSLTIGFARRAASYKRGDLIFRNQQLARNLLKTANLQFIFAGKAHPHDHDGKQIIKNIVQMARRHPQQVCFLENYDIKSGQLLTRGCDVWLNNPTRPMEASGTSGMKAAMNGVLNLATLDGWWQEGCLDGINGWQVGNAYEGPYQDDFDVKSLYHTLQEKVIPLYYHNRTRWLEMMAASIETTQDRFSSEKMLNNYYVKMYGKIENAAGKLRREKVEHNRL